MFLILTKKYAEKVYKTTKSKLASLLDMELHEYDGAGLDKMKFKLRQSMAKKYLERLTEPIDIPLNLCYIPLSLGKIADFANESYGYYSQFQKGRGE